MAKRIALGFLALASPAIVAASLVEHPFGDVLFALLSTAFPFALIVVGAERRGALGQLGRPLLGLLIYYEACVAAMYLARGRVLEAPWALGLPLAAAIHFYGVFLLPLVVVALFYARTFERFGITGEDLDDLRRRFRED